MKNYIPINFIYLRKISYLSQPEFAELFNVSRDKVSAIENDRNKLFDIALIQSICKHFEISIDDLINYDLSKKKDESHFVKERESVYETKSSDPDYMDKAVDSIRESYNRASVAKDEIILTQKEMIGSLNKTVDRLDAILNQNNNVNNLMQKIIDFLTNKNK